MISPFATIGRVAANRDICVHSFHGAWCVCCHWPNNIKRLLAYSSIGHMGFALVGLAAKPGGRTRHCRLYDDLHDHPLLVRLPACWPCAAMAGMWRKFPISRALATTTRLWPLFVDVDVVARWHSATGGFLWQVFCLPRRSKIWPLPLAIIGVLASVVGAYYYLASSRSSISMSPQRSLTPWMAK